MPRLTSEMIASALAFENCFRERELDLRGLEVAQIENLGATRDLYETIDLSDNMIVALENFPRLSRLSTLLLHNNRIRTVAPGLGAALPNLKSLALTNNRLADLSDLRALQGLPSLTHLALLDNPAQRDPAYRPYLISILPRLRVLDYCKVKKPEREAAAKFQARGLVEAATAALPLPRLVDDNGDAQKQARRKQQLREAIQAATSAEELAALERQLVR